MALYDRSQDPLPDVHRSVPNTGLSLLLAAVAAIVLVLAIYAVSRSVGPESNDAASVAQPITPRPAPNR